MISMGFDRGTQRNSLGCLIISHGRGGDGVQTDPGWLLALLVLSPRGSKNQARCKRRKNASLTNFKKLKKLTSENHSKTMENMKMVPLYWLLSGVRARRDDTNGLPLDVRHLLHPTIFPRQIQTICVLVVEKNFSQSKTLNNVKSYSIESFCKQLALA